MLSKVTSALGGDSSGLKNQQQKQDAILNQLVAQSRDTTLKFDEQKKRFDNLTQCIDLIMEKLQIQKVEEEAEE